MKTILCVDSDVHRSESIAKFLESDGEHRVVDISSGLVAQDEIRRNSFDAIVSVYDILDMDGLQLLHSIRKEGIDVPFVLYTAVRDLDIAIEAVNHEWTRFVRRGPSGADRLPVLKAKLHELIEQKEKLSKEREHEELLMSILRTAPDVIFTVDRDLMIIDVYRSDIGPLEVRGKSFLELTDPAHHGLISGEIEKLFRTGEMVSWVARSGGENVKVAWYESNASLLYDGDRVRGAVVVSRDITKRVETESLLRDAEVRIHSMIENSLDGMLLTRPDGSILQANRAFCQMLGMTEEEIVALGRRGLVVVDERLRQALEERARTGRVKTDLTYRRKDGSTFLGETSSSVFMSVDGTRMTSTTVRDITERRHAETALALANRQLNLLNGVTRHDMQNQLSVLSGFIELMSLGGPAPKQAEILKKMRCTVDILVSQLDFTKQYQEIGIHVPVWQSLNHLIGKVQRSLDLGELEIVTPEEDLSIMADPMFEKVIYNLIENVCRHGVNARRLEVAVGMNNGSAVVSFEDDGAGIGDIDRTRLFERGYGRHSGFGLFMSREILGITGLEIAERSRPGKGARFEITVPTGKFRTCSKPMA
jgi:PAS domain S-box-containing protein